MMLLRSRRCPRTQALIGWLGLALLVVFAACSDSTSRVAGPEPNTPPSLEISDAAHGGSTDGFYFLAPLVSSPSYSGTFDATLSPTVHICEGATVSCEGTEVALFTTETGPGSETVRVDETEEHYVVNWHTDEFDLRSGEAYRISVRVAGTLLGYADVMPASNGAEMKNIDGAENIPLKDGRTLPVKFRIEAGTVFPVGSSGETIIAEDGAVVLEIPENALSEEVGITIESGGNVASGVGLVSGAVYDFQPDELQFSEPASLTLAFSLPDDLSASDVTILDELESGEWNELVSSVDASANTVTAPIDGFSRKGVGKRANAVEITPAAAQLDLTDNTTAQFSATVLDATDAELTKRKVRWSVGDEGVASVDKDGLVTAVGDGTTYVEATAGQASGRADVTVGANEPPTAEITSPADGATFDEGEAITFEGSGSDPEDGTLTGASLVWTSDQDGEIGTGSSFTSTLSLGTHTVTLTVTDGGGATGSSAVTFAVEPASSGTGGILFVAGSQHLKRVNFDGSDITALTTDTDPLVHPTFASWSPDGSKVIFSKEQDVYKVNRDGTGEVNLTNSPLVSEFHPKWSPVDGASILFWSVFDGEANVWTMDSDGSNSTNLTIDNTRAASWPDWSPKGDSIVFVREPNLGDGQQIFTMNADGSDATSLTGSGSTQKRPLWSPTGGKIVFQSNHAGSVAFEFGIYIVNSDGSGLEQLAPPFDREEGYVWSSDGTRLALESLRDGGDGDIFVLAADGSSMVNVTDHPAEDTDPLWSPDGSQILFVSDRSGEVAGDEKIYVMDADGSNVREVFDPEGTVSLRLWDWK